MYLGFFYQNPGFLKPCANRPAAFQVVRLFHTVMREADIGGVLTVFVVTISNTLRNTITFAFLRIGICI